MFEMPTDSDFELLYGNLKHKKLLVSGPRHSFVVQLSIMQLSLLMNVKT